MYLIHIPGGLPSNLQQALESIPSWFIVINVIYYIHVDADDLWYRYWLEMSGDTT